MCREKAVIQQKDAPTTTFLQNCAESVAPCVVFYYLTPKQCLRSSQIYCFTHSIRTFVVIHSTGCTFYTTAGWIIQNHHRCTQSLLPLWIMFMQMCVAHKKKIPQNAFMHYSAFLTVHRLHKTF